MSGMCEPCKYTILFFFKTQLVDSATISNRMEKRIRCLSPVIAPRPDALPQPFAANIAVLSNQRNIFSLMFDNQNPDDQTPIIVHSSRCVGPAYSPASSGLPFTPAFPFSISITPRLTNDSTTGALITLFLRPHTSRSPTVLRYLV